MFSSITPKNVYLSPNDTSPSINRRPLVQVGEAEVRGDRAGGAGVQVSEPEGGRHGWPRPGGGVLQVRLLATDCAGFGPGEEAGGLRAGGLRAGGPE